MIREGRIDARRMELFGTDGVLERMSAAPLMKYTNITLLKRPKRRKAIVFRVCDFGFSSSCCCCGGGGVNNFKDCNELLVVDEPPDIASLNASKVVVVVVDGVDSTDVVVVISYIADSSKNHKRKFSYKYTRQPITFKKAQRKSIKARPGSLFASSDN